MTRHWGLRQSTGTASHSAHYSATLLRETHTDTQQPTWSSWYDPPLRWGAGCESEPGGRSRPGWRNPSSHLQPAGEAQLRRSSNTVVTVVKHCRVSLKLSNKRIHSDSMRRMITGLGWRTTFCCSGLLLTLWGRPHSHETSTNKCDTPALCARRGDFFHIIWNDGVQRSQRERRSPGFL